MNQSLVDPHVIDPRPCEWCGLKVDRHRMVDHGEGPEFFCLAADELDLFELELRAELIRQVEVAAIVRDMEMADDRDRWRHTGEPPPETVEAAPSAKPPYRTPQSTIDAFRYVVGEGDIVRLKGWLADRPRDAAFLVALLESSASC